MYVIVRYCYYLNDTSELRDISDRFVQALVQVDRRTYWSRGYDNQQHILSMRNSFTYASYFAFALQCKHKRRYNGSGRLNQNTANNPPTIRIKSNSTTTIETSLLLTAYNCSRAFNCVDNLNKM